MFKIPGMNIHALYYDRVFVSPINHDNMKMLTRYEEVECRHSVESATSPSLCVITSRPMGKLRVSGALL